MEYSLVLIKVAKCGTETVRYLIKESCKDKNIILDSSYDYIFQYQHRQFKYSINHINYDNYFINHLEKIMIHPIKYVGFLRDPLDRLISHYHYSNIFKDKMDFNDWYQTNSQTNSGWGGGCQNSQNSLDVTNNYMSRYLGFNNIDEITEENIKNRYCFIVILEDSNKYEKLSKIIELDNNFVIKNKSQNYNRNISERTKDLFNQNNEMDNKLYKLAWEIYVNNYNK